MERRLGVSDARKTLAQMIDDVKYKGDNYAGIQILTPTQFLTLLALE
jgi:hypothetical protein